MDQLITVQRALEILDATSVIPSTQHVPLAQALGLRLAQEIKSDRDYPPFDKSVMDGYAIRSIDISPTREIIQTIPAGSTAQKQIGPNQAAAIMTGAPLPPGADAVIPIEETTRQNNQLTLNSPARAGFSIAPRGSDIQAGKIVLPKGIRLGPAQLAVAASVGAATISVYTKPKVALLSTGDELIEIDRTPTGAQIRNSNSYMMESLLTRLNCEVQNLGIVGDDPPKIKAALTHGLQFDALFITGGMSMGERDYIPGLLKQLNLTLRITKLRIKPGKPFIFATKEDTTTPKYVFGLPGNPVSAFVCTIRLAARILSRLSGGTPAPDLIHAKLDQPLPSNGSREFHQPAHYTGSAVHPLPWNGSADIYTLALANALIIRPENTPPAAVGDIVQLIDLSRFE